MTREVILEGTLTAANRLTWLERPFDVPPGTAVIRVDTSYSDRDGGTAIEFGLYDPARFRGASRTSKTPTTRSRAACSRSAPNCRRSFASCRTAGCARG